MVLMAKIKKMIAIFATIRTFAATEAKTFEEAQGRLKLIQAMCAEGEEAGK